MFIGHFALSLAGKRLAPKTSLGTLMLSVSFLDLLWPFFVFFGLEHVRIAPGITAVTPLDFVSYPYSHSLLMSVGWSLLFGGLYFFFRRDIRGAIVLAFGVVSHWILDFASHRPDMPLLPSDDGMKLGLGLWNSVPATLAVEVSMFMAGIWIYSRATHPSDKIGKWGFWSFMAFLLFLYLGNVFGPPPPSERALAVFGVSSLVLYAWPYWVDRHRTAP